jgi:DNA-binding phage protein
MSLAARMKDKFRSRLVRFVEKERAAVGCAKTAMANVARKVGMSVISLYRIMNNHPKPVKIEAHHHAALLIHTLGIAKAAASRMRSKRHASTIHA